MAATYGILAAIQGFTEGLASGLEKRKELELKERELELQSGYRRDELSLKKEEMLKEDERFKSKLDLSERKTSALEKKYGADRAQDALEHEYKRDNDLVIQNKRSVSDLQKSRIKIKKDLAELELNDAVAPEVRTKQKESLESLLVEIDTNIENINSESTKLITKRQKEEEILPIKRKAKEEGIPGADRLLDGVESISVHNPVMEASLFTEIEKLPESKTKNDLKERLKQKMLSTRSPLMMGP